MRMPYTMSPKPDTLTPPCSPGREMNGR